MRTRTVHGACHHDCPDSCGWTVTVDESGPTPVAVKLRGNPDHPFSLGELCPKVNRYLDRVHSPERILTRCAASAPKGTVAFEPISWDDALDDDRRPAGRRSLADARRRGRRYPYSDAGNQSLLSMFGPATGSSTVSAPRAGRSARCAVRSPAPARS